MRLGFGSFVVALALGACAEDKGARIAADWGCGPVEGVKAISGERGPAWILVGEFTETAEAPAAITDIACNLAAGGDTLFVGFQDYLGGATDAELKMIASLDVLIRKGAPIVLEPIGREDHPYAVHDKSRAEQAWAKALTDKVAGAHAHRALLFLSRADAIAQPIPPSGERFAGYTPMPVFLEGGVVSLEVAGNPIPGASGPAIRIHPSMKDGFSGQLMLASLTRPMVAVLAPGRDASLAATLDPAAAPERATALEILETAKKAQREAEIEQAAKTASEHLGEAYAPAPPVSDQERRKLLDQLMEGLPREVPE